MEIKWKSASLRGRYSLKQGNPLQFFKILIQLYLFCLFFYFWLTVSKRVSKAIFLEMNWKSVGLRESYGLKQGNPLQNLKISNQIIFVLSPDLLFYLMYQKVYQRWDVLRLNEYVGLWGIYSLKQGNPLYFLSKHSFNYICYVHFFILWLTVSKRVTKIIIWRLNEKCVGLWGSYGLKQGNPLQFFQNTN